MSGVEEPGERWKLKYNKCVVSELQAEGLVTKQPHQLLTRKHSQRSMLIACDSSNISPL